MQKQLIKKMQHRADAMIAENLSRTSKKYIKKTVLSRSFRIDPFFWNNGALSWSLVGADVNTPVNHNLISGRLDYHLVDNSLFYYANYDGISEADIARVVDLAMKLKRNEKGSILYRPNDVNVFIDALGMVPQLLVRYGVEHNREDILHRGIEQFDIFMDSAIDSSTELPYHGYNSLSGKKMGVIGWGRGLGWILIGLAETLYWLDKDSVEFKKLQDYFLSLVNASMRYQMDNGAFGWQLQALDGPEDTSTTSMIGFAIARYNSKTDADIYDDECARMAEFIVSNVRGEDGSVMNSSAECRGLSMYPQVFENNSWGQGFSVLFLQALESLNSVKSR